jgi:phosphohistidine phosphatase
MRVYLVRHGKASKDTQLYQKDEERPLTKRGRADVERIAQLVGASGAEVYQIRHSGLVRARETAEIFAKHLTLPGGVIQVAGLLSGDPVEDLPRELAMESAPVMLVGHNPFMERLAALLLTGSENKSPAHFGTSGTACFENLNGEWMLRWLLNPEVMGDEDA